MYIRNIETLADLLFRAETAHKLAQDELVPWPVWYANWIYAELIRQSERTTQYDTMSMEYALENFAPDIAPTNSIATCGPCSPWPRVPVKEEKAHEPDYSLGCMGGC